MEIDVSLKSIHVFEALASDARISILEKLSEKDKNIKELSDELYMSSAMVSRHVQKLEQAELIKTYTAPAKFGIQKRCSLSIENLSVVFPRKIYSAFKIHRSSIRLGHYIDFEVHPTCGLATKDIIIGIPDDPRCFMDSQRMDADIIWFGQGHVEYKFPNIVSDTQTPEVLEMSLEMSSEFPGSNNTWPSDITFYINDTEVGTWTVPGNFSDVRGKLTPSWWPDNNSQYGLMKTLRINNTQTNIDGEKISGFNINDIDFDNHFITLRLAVKNESENVGGLTLYGSSFGNHPQDICCSVYYSETS